MVRFAINGVLAAGVHFLVLVFCLEALELHSAGLANGIAATFGTAASFVGSRYYVFRAHEAGICAQLARFGLLYAAMAALHGAVLWLWTDVRGLDYRVGFLLGTALQAALTYLGSRFWVFR